MVGNCVAVFALAKWEGAFDQARFDAAVAAAKSGQPGSALVLEKQK
jgi:hypothetical protein